MMIQKRKGKKKEKNLLKKFCLEFEIIFYYVPQKKITQEKHFWYITWYLI